MSLIFSFCGRAEYGFWGFGCGGICLFLKNQGKGGQSMQHMTPPSQLTQSTSETRICCVINHLTAYHQVILPTVLD